MSRQDELERVLAQLDTLYDDGMDCLLPPDTPTWILDEFGLDADEPVPDLRYDALKRRLHQLAPDSDHFSRPTAAKLKTGTRKIPLTRPMVSIDKACHEDRHVQEQMLFKWMHDCVSDGPAHAAGLHVQELEARELPERDPATLREIPGTVRHWPRKTFNGKVMAYPRGYFSVSMKLDGCSVRLVICVNNLEDQEALGRRGDAVTGNPRGKIAWKFAEEYADVVINDIMLSTGRTGAIKPVACFAAVPLAGTMVSRAALHNYGFLVRSRIAVGTTVRVIKSGKIIPKVIGVQAGQSNGTPGIPHECPSCGQAARLLHAPAKGSQEETWELRCENSDCPAQLVSSLLYFLKTMGVLGLGEVTVTALVDAGVVARRSDFYALDEESCGKAGLSERQSLLAVGNIWRVHDPEHMSDEELRVAIADARHTGKVTVPAWQFLTALGIPSADKGAAKDMLNHFRSFKALRQASEEALMAVGNIGRRTADSVITYFRQQAKEIDRLLRRVELELPRQGSLSGKTFCLSGSLLEGKKHWQARIEEHGGVVTDGVGKMMHSHPNNFLRDRHRFRKWTWKKRFSTSTWTTCWWTSSPASPDYRRPYARNTTATWTMCPASSP